MLCFGCFDLKCLDTHSDEFTLTLKTRFNLPRGKKKMLAWQPPCQAHQITMRCQNKENFFTFFFRVYFFFGWLDWILGPYLQLLDGALAAVYFVNGLFQLSLSVARVPQPRPSPHAVPTIEILLTFCVVFFFFFFWPTKRGIENWEAFWFVPVLQKDFLHIHIYIYMCICMCVYFFFFFFLSALLRCVK